MSEPAALNNSQDLFLQALRRETSESHQQLESNPLSIAILQPAVTISSYQDYLAKMYGIMLAVENEIFPLLSGVIADLDERKKAAYIAADLKSTGLDETFVQSLPVHSFGQLAIPQAMGAMYVLEGSTLGGRVLFKHVHQHLGLTGEHGARFFSGYGVKTGMLWKSFIASFAQYAVAHGETETIIESAKKTFITVDHWLSAEIESLK